jgi:serine/threonine-protein kinase RsbT
MAAATRTERLAIRSSEDVVKVRQQTRIFAVAAGLSLVDQTKIITAASELARNTLDYGGGAKFASKLRSMGADVAYGSPSKTGVRAFPTLRRP